MLTQKELNKLKEKAKSSKTIKSLLSLIESDFTDNSPLQNAFTKAKPDMSDCISPTRKKLKARDELDYRKKEIKGGFKIRTTGESQESDDGAANKNK